MLYFLVTVDWAALAKQWIAQREAVGTEAVPVGGIAQGAPAPPPPPPEGDNQVVEPGSQNDMEICEDEGPNNQGIHQNSDESFAYLYKCTGREFALPPALMAAVSAVSGLAK